MSHHIISQPQQKKWPGDILGVIFESLYCIAPASLWQLRLASTEINHLINPVVYRHLTLNNALVRCFNDESTRYDSVQVVHATRRVKNAVCAFTRQITIDKELDWSLVDKILLSLRQFHHLNWSFWLRPASFVSHPRAYRVPRSILHCLAKCWPNAKISVDSPSSVLDSIDDLRGLPPAKLVSLKLQTILPHGSNMVDGTLKTFLLQCDQLKVLHLLNVENGHRFLDKETAQSEKLPAVEQLFLQGYFWLHSRQIANSLWDWRRLTSLRLEKVFIVHFLLSVLPENLVQLRSLITDGHCKSAADYTTATKLMANFVSVIDGLHTLSLCCSVDIFPMNTIGKHGSGLRVLSLREYEGIVHQPLRQNRVPTFSIHALLEIPSSCPNILELTLDLDQGMMSSSFTSLLLQCRNLRRLTMFVQQPFLNGVDINNDKNICKHIDGNGRPYDCLDPYDCLNRSCLVRDSIEVGAASTFVDRTYEAVCTFFQDLLLRKQGVAFENLTMHVAGTDDKWYPKILSVQGQRQQLSRESHKRTFVYEPRHGRPMMSFERQSVQETTAESLKSDDDTDLLTLCCSNTWMELADDELIAEDLHFNYWGSRRRSTKATNRV